MNIALLGDSLVMEYMNQIYYLRQAVITILIWFWREVVNSLS